jgi:hypothetical protein
MAGTPAEVPEPRMTNSTSVRGMVKGSKSHGVGKKKGLRD